MSRKRLPVWRTLLVMAVDFLAIGLGLWLAYLIRFDSPLTARIPIQNGYDPRHYMQILPWAWVLWLVALRLENLYRRHGRVFDFSVFRRLLTGSCLAMLLLIACSFYLPDRSRVGAFSRLVTLISLLSVTGCLLAGRVGLHYLFRWLLVKRGLGQSRMAVLGSGERALQICRALEGNPYLGIKPVGLISAHASDQDSAQASARYPVLGGVEELEQVLALNRIDELVLLQSEVPHERIPHLLLQCERAMAEFRIVPQTTELLLSGMTVETLDGIPLLGIRETPLQGWNAALKRLIDIILATTGLLFVGPLIVLFAWLVKRQDGHSPFFTQERMGIDGRMFHIIKLRTMRPDAEKESGPVFASDRDHRCTRLGSFLRQSHLDELPQLVNVLRGEMSMVGPRPERPYFIEQFRDHVPRYMARHKVRSGITGWAQVNGLCGKHGSINERLDYDLYYIENWSLWLDVKIMIKTVIGRVRPGPA